MTPIYAAVLDETHAVHVRLTRPGWFRVVILDTEENRDTSLYRDIKGHAPALAYARKLAEV